MPGIAGIIQKCPDKDVEGDLTRMVQSMRHESFYRGGEYINKDLGLYLGWMGHQGGFSDCMPLVSRDNDVVLIFQGENYVGADTLAQLRRSGNEVDESNGRYLLQLYEALGDRFILDLNGWFSGVIADLRKRTITLFNDRYGMGRIYFYEGEAEFIFASEAKALLKIRRDLQTMDHGAVAQYLRGGCVMGHKTLFKGITLLPNGSSWVFEGDSVPKKKRYFEFSEWERQKPLGLDELYQNFETVVSTTFPKYAESSQRVAVSLTAGLDTRTIMASLQGEERRLPCYTFGGTWGETFDIRTAREVARVRGQQHDVIKISEAFFRDFPDLARKTIYISDGTHDAFGAHDLYFNQIAREIAPVRLTGKFGSEVVRVRKTIPWEKFSRDLLNPAFLDCFDEAKSLDRVTQTGNALSRAVCEEIPWYEFGRVAVEQSQVTLRTPYMDNELVKLMFQAPSELRANGNLQAQYVKAKSPELNKILTNLSRSGEGHWLFQELTYLAFWSLFKAEYIYLFATPHWLTRIDRSMERLALERFLAGRQKFEAYRIWIKTKLSEFICDILLDSGVRYSDIFRKDCVEKMVMRHVAGTHNYLNEINKVLTIELINLSLLSG